MSLVKVALLASGLSLALAMSASGQAGRESQAEVSATPNLDLNAIPEGTGLHLGARSTRQKIGKKGHATLAPHRVELSARTMIYKHQGKLYLVTDKPVGGRMLFDQSKDWEHED